MHSIRFDLSFTSTAIFAKITHTTYTAKEKLQNFGEEFVAYR